jgi:hypothetical protein
MISVRELSVRVTLFHFGHEIHRTNFPGVLTKPDALPPGASTMRRKWKSILRGEEHQLKHGYYCVRLLDDEERASAVSRVEARKIATELFNTPAWSDTDQKRCGVPNLVSDISGLLIGLIAKKYATYSLSFEFTLIKRD